MKNNKKPVLTDKEIQELYDKDRCFCILNEKAPKKAIIDIVRNFDDEIFSNDDKILLLAMDALYKQNIEKYDDDKKCVDTIRNFITNKLIDCPFDYDGLTKQLILEEEDDNGFVIYGKRENRNRRILDAIKPLIEKGYIHKLTKEEQRLFPNDKKSSFIYSPQKIELETSYNDKTKTIENQFHQNKLMEYVFYKYGFAGNRIIKNLFSGNGQHDNIMDIFLPYDKQESIAIDEIFIKNIDLLFNICDKILTEQSIKVLYNNEQFDFSPYRITVVEREYYIVGYNHNKNDAANDCDNIVFLKLDNIQKIEDSKVYYKNINDLFMTDKIEYRRIIYKEHKPKKSIQKYPEKIDIDKYLQYKIFRYFSKETIIISLKSEDLVFLKKVKNAFLHSKLIEKESRIIIKDSKEKLFNFIRDNASKITQINIINKTKKD